jgi:hypothetical protein
MLRHTTTTNTTVPIKLKKFTSVLNCLVLRYDFHSGCGRRVVVAVACSRCAIRNCGSLCIPCTALNWVSAATTRQQLNNNSKARDHRQLGSIRRTEEEDQQDIITTAATTVTAVH